RPFRCGSTITISPSITALGGKFAFTAATTSGKYRVIGRSLRLPISTSSPSRKMIVRKPSHFGSYDAPGGISGTDFDSIGATGGMTGSFMGTLLARLRLPGTAAQCAARHRAQFL